MNPTEKIRLAISTCPNDTFAFHAILENKIDLDGLELEIELLDIQQLNRGLFANQFDVAKASFHAAVLLADDYLVLPSGSALGFGVGPLLLSAEEATDPLAAGKLTLCPGEHTTATLLFRLFYGLEPAVEQTVFSEIMSRLKRGEGDFGVCIHEGRFTWQSEGLFLVEDLGERWEAETSTPLPLGGILASRQLPSDRLLKIQLLVQQSIEYGLANRQETLVSMRKYAQELDDRVMFQHVDLYVNDWTRELGATGREALAMFSEKAIEIGLASPDARPLEVGCG